MDSNEKWFAAHECYVCERWQYTVFLYQWNYDYLTHPEKFALGNFEAFESENFPFNQKETRLVLKGSFHSTASHLRDSTKKWEGLPMISVVDYAKKTSADFKVKETLLQEYKEKFTDVEIKVFESQPNFSWDAEVETLVF